MSRVRFYCTVCSVGQGDLVELHDGTGDSSNRKKETALRCYRAAGATAEPARALRPCQDRISPVYCISLTGSTGCWSSFFLRPCGILNCVVFLQVYYAVPSHLPIDTRPLVSDDPAQRFGDLHDSTLAPIDQSSGSLGQRSAALVRTGTTGRGTE